LVSRFTRSEAHTAARASHGLLYMIPTRHGCRHLCEGSKWCMAVQEWRPDINSAYLGGVLLEGTCGRDDDLRSLSVMGDGGGS
jgi:hypothetical protein